MREIRVPLSLLLAFVGGSDHDLDGMIADAVGYVTDDEIEEYAGNHLRGNHNANLSRAIVNGWRREQFVKEEA